MRSLSLAILAVLLLSCAAGPRLPAVGLDLFAPAPASDPWRHKIHDWQMRHASDRALHARTGMRAEESELAREYREFANVLRRRLVDETVRWVQERSREHYRPDGERDHWATLGEVIASGEDDCDGLDVLTFVLLRRLGFREHEIFRAIIVERESGQHHMVTLWFDRDERSDPLVLDPTGVVARKVVRLSSLEGWAPIQLFDEVSHYRVERSPRTPAVAQR
ncbi:MAG: hypothetical protein ACE5FG_11530 [Myxococcota bacterium]